MQDLMETIHPHIWWFWGVVRHKDQDTEDDCPWCGLNLPWPQMAFMSPHETEVIAGAHGGLEYQVKGVRTCPRCHYQWYTKQCYPVYPQPLSTTAIY